MAVPIRWLAWQWLINKANTGALKLIVAVQAAKHLKRFFFKARFNANAIIPHHQLAHIPIVLITDCNNRGSGFLLNLIPLATRFCNM
jgi:hypothetical protein